MKFYLTILGAGSPSSAADQHTSAQALTVDDDLYLIDCGDDAQRQMRRYNLPLLKLKAIFISHTHTDHIMGLPALLQTLNRLNRSEALDIFAPPSLENWVKSFLPFFPPLQFFVNYRQLDDSEPYPVYTNKNITVTAFPLDHGVPAWGFLFKENKKKLDVVQDKIAMYKIPESALPGIRLGGDYRAPDGSVIPNRRLVMPPLMPRSYAYCSDTSYQSYIAEVIKGANIVYHEATFAEADHQMAFASRHSTSCDAANIAKAAEAERLLIGHISGRYKEPELLVEEAQKIFANTALAVEGNTIGITHKNWPLQDTWDVFEDFFIPGSIVKGSISELTADGAVVKLEYNATGSIAADQMVKRDGLKAAVNDELEFRVIDFNKSNKSIVLSHRLAYNGLYINESETTGAAYFNLMDDLPENETTASNIATEPETTDSKPFENADGNKNATAHEIEERSETQTAATTENIDRQEKTTAREADKEFDYEQHKRQQRAKILSKFSKGQVVDGYVKRFTYSGVLVDLGGITGRIDIADLAWEWVHSPADVLEIGQTVTVKVLDIDENLQMISLGVKQLTRNPWDSSNFDLRVGDVVNGTVTGLTAYGAFLEVAQGINGLLHVSELSWSQDNPNIQDFCREGDIVEAVITTLERSEQRLLLSVKRLTPDPWDSVESEFAVGTQHKARIYGADKHDFLAEVDGSVQGRIHVTDLSWTKKFLNTSELEPSKDEIDVVILDISRLNRCLYLGHKQLKDNPWPEYADIFKPGTVHDGEIVKFVEQGALVALEPSGVEGFTTRKHIIKDNGIQAQVKERLRFRVVKFDTASECIQLCLYHEGEAEGEDFHIEQNMYADISKFAKKFLHQIEYSKNASKQRKEAREQRVTNDQVLGDLKGSLKKSTLGDLAGLEALKDKFGSGKKE